MSNEAAMSAHQSSRACASDSESAMRDQSGSSNDIGGESVMVNIDNTEDMTSACEVRAAEELSLRNVGQDSAVHDDDGETNSSGEVGAVVHSIQESDWEELLSRDNVVLPYNFDRRGRMHLLKNETQWGMAIKESVENDPEINNLTDYFYAQLGIVEMENGDNLEPECVLERVRALQDLKQEFDILDTLQDSIKSIRDYMELFPNWFVHLTYDDKEGGFVFVCDATQINLRSVRINPNAAKILTKGVYYFNHAFASDFEAIRRGVTCTVECGNFSPSTSVDISTMRCTHDVFGNYPWNLRKSQFFHCGVLMKVVLSMSRPFTPKKFRDKFQFGFTCPVRLDELFMQPTKEDARQKILARFEEALHRRYQNEASFTFE